MPRLADAGTDFPVREPRSIFWRPAELPVCRGATRLPEQNPLALRNLPGDDTWTAQPFAEGVVLIGDAAGYNDPIAAQGLSISAQGRPLRARPLSWPEPASHPTLPPTERNARSGCNVFGS